MSKQTRQTVRSVAKGKMPARPATRSRVGRARAVAAARDVMMDIAPIATASSKRLTPAKFKTAREGVRVEHREFLGNVNGTVGYNVAQFPVNPGISLTFPWLSGLASQWEQYRFIHVQFEYITRSPTTQPGSVLMAPDYDAADGPPATESAMAQYQDVIEDAPWKNSICFLSTRDQAPGTFKYVRDSIVPLTDIKTYDLANFFIATVGTDSNTWGKLWVKYDVELRIPAGPSRGLGVTALSYFTNAATQGLTGGSASVLAASNVVANPLGFNLQVSGPGTVFTATIAGNFLINLISDVDGQVGYPLILAYTFQKNGLPFANGVSPAISTPSAGFSHSLVTPFQNLAYLAVGDTFLLTCQPTVGSSNPTIATGKTSLAIFPA